MQNKLSKLSMGLAASALLFAATPTMGFAQEPGYLGSASGGAVRDPFGVCLRSPGGAMIAECMPAVATVEPEPSVMMMSLGADANFDFDRSNLRPEGQTALRNLAREMEQVQVRSIDIVGHTDSIGSEQYNQGLSERRAQSAANFLIAEGVNPNLITTRGESFRQPIAPNTTPDGRDNPSGRAQNRRVDISVDAEARQ